MNAFFLFNYLGRPDHKGPKQSGIFIVTELKFNEAQVQEFNTTEDQHHNRMRDIGYSSKLLKDELFHKITASAVNESSVDSLIILISYKEKLKEKEMFSRLRSVYKLCNDEQKERFNEILKRARKFDNKRPKRKKKSE
jgi:hypothetical protein